MKHPDGSPITRRQFVGALGASAGLMALETMGARMELPTTDFSALIGPGGPDWQKVRKGFLLPNDLVYLNNGSLGPNPAYVIERMFEAWRILEENPVEQGFGPLLEKAEAVRSKAAAFLGCTKEEMAITQNTTEGMNAVAQGIEWNAADRVLTTDHEHPGGLVGWQYVARKRSVILDTVALPAAPRDANEIVKLFESKLTKQTRVISVSHVTFSTGLRLPIAELASLARANGSLLVVDGAQAPGGIVVDVKKLGCHAYATSAHKWLLAPMGTGLLCISEDAKARIDPMMLAAGHRVYTAHTGTRNLPAIIGLGAAMEFLDKLGRQAVEARALDLRQRLYEALTKLPKIRLASPPAGPLASPILTIELPKEINSGALADRLNKTHRIVVKVVTSNLVNGLRFSTHSYNSDEDISRTVNALKREL